MNEYIMDLASIDYLSLITSVVIIMGAVIALKELLERFCNTVGIELYWVREKRELKNCQETVKKELADLKERQYRFEQEHRENIEKRNEFNEQIISAINMIKDSIVDFKAEIERKEAEKKFEKLRDDIINFANELSMRESVSHELIANIYKKINYYEKLHKDYNFENNQAPVSIEVIKQKYQEMLKNGHVTKEGEN